MIGRRTDGVVSIRLLNFLGFSGQARYVVHRGVFQNVPRTSDIFKSGIRDNFEMWNNGVFAYNEKYAFR